MDDQMQVSDLLDAGRHAFDEDAELTPIFSALTRGGWRQRQSEYSAEERFRRDPLTAPIPVVPVGRPAVPAGEGRHHRRRRDRLGIVA